MYRARWLTGQCSAAGPSASPIMPCVGHTGRPLTGTHLFSVRLRQKLQHYTSLQALRVPWGGWRWHCELLLHQSEQSAGMGVKLPRAPAGASHGDKKLGEFSCCQAPFEFKLIMPITAKSMSLGNWWGHAPNCSRQRLREHLYGPLPHPMGEVLHGCRASILCTGVREAQT